MFILKGIVYDRHCDMKYVYTCNIHIWISYGFHGGDWHSETLLFILRPSNVQLKHAASQVAYSECCRPHSAWEGLENAPTVVDPLERTTLRHSHNKILGNNASFT
jgi:hypothetical protein